MARAPFYLFFVGFLINLVVSSELPESRRNGKSLEITNLDFVFPTDELLKTTNGRTGRDKSEKDKKKKKKKKHHSSSSEEEKDTKPITEIRRPTGSRDDSRIHQQEVVARTGRNPRGSREEVPAYEDAITIRGPIRRKPLIFPSDDGKMK